MDDAKNIRLILGQNIRRYRLLRNFTQSKLAEMIDVSFRYVGFIENGQAYPSSTVLAAISKVLDVPVYRLFIEYETESSDLKNLCKYIVENKLKETVKEISSMIDEV